MTGKAYGIGVGPGDPKLLTLKAIDLLQELKIIFYPSFGKKNIALDTSLSYINPHSKLIKMDIPLSPYESKIAAYQEYADQMKEFLNNHIDVGVLCEGDPLFFGSFITIRDLLKDSHEIRIVSGISSIMAAFPHIDDFMGQGDDSISIITASAEEDVIKDKISKSNTTIIIKVTKHFKRIKKIVNDLGLTHTSHFISQIDQEQQYSDRLNNVSEDVIEYFAIIIIKNPKLGL
tara:strand:+ start:145 stop:840 length:696 start_codon:yes stop_codon:yes gene_type:complete